MHNFFVIEHISDKVTILSDGTTSNETRLGALGSMKLALEKVLGFKHPALVIAGDTMLDKTFDLQDFMRTYFMKNEKVKEQSLF